MQEVGTNDSELLIVRQNFEQRLSKVLKLDLPFQGVDLKTFDPDVHKCQFKDEARDNLKKIAEVLKESPEACIRVFGYTGPPDHPNCISLSLARTRQVREALKAAGCNHRIAAKGMGFADNQGPRCELALCSPDEVNRIEAEVSAMENAFEFRLAKVFSKGIDFQGVDLKTFNPDSDPCVLKPESVEKLRQIAQVLKESPSTCVRIFGYSGGPPDPKSVHLSLARTRHVREALLKEACVNKIVCKGWGFADDLGPRCEFATCTAEEAATIEAEMQQTLADIKASATSGSGAAEEKWRPKLDIVFLSKDGVKVPITLVQKPLGLTFSSKTTPIVITKLVEGGHARMNGVEIGMQVVDVNGVNVTGKSYDDTFELLKNGTAQLSGTAW